MITFDELNRLNGIQRSIPYEEYFGEMVLPEDSKKKRIDLAERFEDEIVFVLAWAFYTAQQREITKEEIEPVLKEHYLAAVKGIDVEGDIKDYIDNIVGEIAQTTADHANDAYTFSQDRAQLIAENEANTLVNMQEFSDAKGRYQYKRWNTILDGRERPTHAFADGQEVEVHLPFEVGGFFMNFPKDDSFGAPPEEIVNCRCSVTYF